jgi:hypothetical protein
MYSNDFVEHGKQTGRLDEVERASMERVAYRLESYHYICSGNLVHSIRRGGCPVFLDSGAFSAFTSGVEIDLAQYCAYIQENDDTIRKEDGVVLASVLDAIGDPLKTWQNQKAMERIGVTPLPCFHYGDDERFLQEYVKNYRYITLGGMVSVSSNQLKLWLDRIWDMYLTDGAGRPLLKVHGFGLMSEDLLTRYPWHSADSSSWVQASSFGTLLAHKTHGKTWPSLCISGTSPNTKKQGAHFDNMPVPLRDAYAEDIARRGYDVDRLRDNYWSRRAYNLQLMNEMNERYAELKTTFRPVQRGLF